MKEKYKALICFLIFCIVVGIVNTVSYSKTKKEKSKQVDIKVVSEEKPLCEVQGHIFRLNNFSQRKFIFVGDSYGVGVNGDGHSWVTYLTEFWGLKKNEDYFENCVSGSAFYDRHLKEDFDKESKLCWTKIIKDLDSKVKDKDAITDIVFAGGYNESVDYISETKRRIIKIREYCEKTYPNARLWIVPIGWSGKKEKQEALLKIYSEAYKKAEGYTYVDNAYVKLEKENGFSNDGVHPNSTGYRSIAAKMAGLLCDEPQKCIASVSCVNCDVKYGDIHKNVHTCGTKTVGKKNPTCTEKGKSGDVYCAGCNKLLSKSTEISAFGHTFENKLSGKCSRCGKVRYDGTVEIDEKEYTYKKGVLVKSPEDSEIIATEQ